MPTDTPPPASPLSIAVLGSGAIGSTFAYQLAHAGHAVTAIARPNSSRLDQLRRDQAIVLTTGEKASLRVADQLDEHTAYDLVLVTTLAHQAAALLPPLQRSQAKSVQFMFNTFEPERFQAALGVERSSVGLPFVMSTLDDDGRLKTTISSRRKTLHGKQRWKTLFDQAGIPSAYEANMPLWLRCHAPLCIAMESISFSAQQRGRGASWAEARKVARGLHGGFKIVEALGNPLYPASKKRLNDLPDNLLAGMLWFLSKNKTFRELLATGVQECRALIDGIVEAAKGSERISPASLEAVRALWPADQVS